MGRVLRWRVLGIEMGVYFARTGTNLYTTRVMSKCIKLPRCINLHVGMGCLTLLIGRHHLFSPKPKTIHVPRSTPAASRGALLRRFRSAVARITKCHQAWNTARGCFF